MPRAVEPAPFHSETLRKALIPAKRARVARALDSVGLLDRFLWLKGKLKFRQLAVLTYHRIARLDDIGDMDPGVVEAEPEGLAQQLAVVQTHCTVVSMAEVRLFTQGRPLPKNPVMLGFDDGYAECHDVVLPILRRVGVPATFFIPTAFPDAGRLFWWDRVSIAIRRCRHESIELTYPARLVLQPRQDPDAAVVQVCRAIKRIPGVDIARCLEDLERATGVTLTTAEERQLAQASIMSWSQVRRLRAAGMDVQSHSHSHQVLDTLTPDEAERDLLRSRKVLSEALGEPVRSVAYPVGYTLRGPFRRAAERAGFDLGFTNSTGVCQPSRSDPLNLPRLAVDREHAGALYKLLLVFGERPNPAAIRSREDVR